MSKNLLDLRFAVRRNDGYTSSLWRLWISRKGDVYLSSSKHGGVIKFSFHKSGRCRKAFTSDYGTPKKLNERAMYKWWRAKTEKKGSGKASRIAWIGFPTNYLSREIDLGNKDITWIKSAPKDKATFIQLAFTKEDERTVTALLNGNKQKVIKYINLPFGEAFIIFYGYDDWENNDLKSPAAEDSIFPDLIFSEEDPKNTGRPVRIEISPMPKDGDCVIITELGGYKAENS